MTKLGIIAKGDKSAILQAISLLNKVDELTIIFTTQKEGVNLYVVDVVDFYKLKGGMHR